MQMQKVTRGAGTDKPDHFLSTEMLDREARQRLARFKETIDKTIYATNRSVIHSRVPNLNQDSFLRLATRVAELRADYLAKALSVSAAAGRPSQEAIADLRHTREGYEELLKAFDAMERAIERGYADMA